MANVGGRVRSTDSEPPPRPKSAVSKLLGKSSRTQKNPSAPGRGGRDNLGFTPSGGGATGPTDAEGPTPAAVLPCAADDGDLLGQEAQRGTLVVANKRTVKCGSCSLENRLVAEDKKRTEKLREIGGRPNFSRIPEEGPYSGPGRTLAAGVRRRSDFMPGSPIAKCGSTTALEALSETPIYEELDLKCSSSRDLNSSAQERGFGSPDGCSLADQPSFSQHRLSLSSRYLLEHRGLYSRPSCGVRIAELRASRKQEALRSSPSTTATSSRSSSSASQSCSESLERGGGGGGGGGGGHRSSLDLNVTYVERFDETASKASYGSPSQSPASCCPSKSPSLASCKSTPSGETQATRPASTSSTATQTTPTTSNRQGTTNAPRLAIVGRPAPSGRRETEARSAASAGPCPPVSGRLQGVRRQSSDQRVTGTEPERATSEALVAQDRLPGGPRARLSSGALRSFSESDGFSDCDISLASTNTLTDSYGDDFSEDIGNDDLRSSVTTDDGDPTTPDPSPIRPDDRHSNATDPTTTTTLGGGGVRRQTQAKGVLPSAGRRLPGTQRPPVQRLEGPPAQWELGVGRKCLASSVSCPPLLRSANPNAARKSTNLLQAPNSTVRPNIQRIENFGQNVNSRAKAQSVTTMTKSSSSTDLLPTNPHQEAPGIAQAKRPTATRANCRSSSEAAAAASRVVHGSRQRIPVLSSTARLRATAERRMERSDSHPVAASAAAASNTSSSSARPAPSLTLTSAQVSSAHKRLTANDSAGRAQEDEEEEEECPCDSPSVFLCSSSSSNSGGGAARLIRSVSSPVGSNQLHPMSAGGSTCRTEDVEGGKRCSNADVFLQHQQQLSPIAERSPRRRSSSEHDPSAALDGPVGGPSPSGPPRAGDAVRATPSKAAAAVPLFRRLSSSQRATSLSKISEKSISQVAKPESSEMEKIHGRQLSPKSPEDQNILKSTEISKSQANIYDPASAQAMRSNGIRSNNSSSCVALNACRGLHQKTPPVQPELGAKQRARVTDSTGPESPAKSKSFAQSPNTSAATSSSEKAKEARNRDSRLASAVVDPSRSMFQSKLKAPTDFSGAGGRFEKTGEWKNSDRYSQGSKIETSPGNRAKETEATVQPLGMTSVFKHLQMKHVKPYSCATNKSFSVVDKFTKTRINPEREKEKSKDNDNKRHDDQDTALPQQDIIHGITPKQQQQRRRQQQQHQQQRLREATASAQSYADPHDELENQKLPVTDDVLSPAQILRADDGDNSRSGTLIGRIRGEAPSGGGGAGADEEEEGSVVCSASGEDFELKCGSARNRSADQSHRETDQLDGDSQVENERSDSLSSTEQRRSKCCDDFAASELSKNEAEIAERASEGVLDDDTCLGDSFPLSERDASIVGETEAFDSSSRATDLGRATEVNLRLALEREESSVSRVDYWRPLRSDHHSKPDQGGGPPAEPMDVHRQTSEAILIKSSNRNSLVLVEPETVLRGDIDKFIVTYESNNVIVLERADSLAKSIEQTSEGEPTDSSSSAAAPREISGKSAENFDGSRSSTDARAITSPKWEPGGIPLSESGYDSWKSQSSKSSARFLKLSDTEMHAIFGFAGAQFITCSEIGDQSTIERCLDSKNSILMNDFSSKNTNVDDRNGVDDKNRFKDICNKSTATASVRDSETSVEHFGCQVTETGDDEGQDDRADDLFSGILMSENIFSGEFCPAVDSFPSSCSSFATVNSATLIRANGDDQFELNEEKWADHGDSISPPSLLLLSPGEGDCFESLDLPDAAAFEAWSPMRTTNSAAFHSKDYHNQIYKLDFGTGDSGELTNDPEEADGSGGGAGRRTQPAALPGAWQGVDGKPSDGEDGRWQGRGGCGVSSRRWASSGRLPRDDGASSSSEFSRCTQAARVHSNTFPLTIRKTFADVFTTREARNFAETCQIFSKLSQLKQKTERDTFYENVCDALLENMDPDQSDSDATASPTALEFDETATGQKFPDRISQNSVQCDKVESHFNLSNKDNYLLTKCGDETTTRDVDVRENQNQNNSDNISENSPVKQLSHQQRLMTTENTSQTSATVANESGDSRIDASLCPVSSVKETFSIAQYCIDENSLMLGGDIGSAQNTVQTTAKVSNTSQVDCSQNQSYKVPDQSSRKPDLKASLSKQETTKTPDSKTQAPAPQLLSSANEATKTSSSGILSRYFPALLRKSSKDRNIGNQEVLSRAEKSLSLDRSTTVGSSSSSRSSAAVVFRDRKLRNSNIEEPRSVKDVIRHFEDQTAAALKESTLTERTAKVSETPVQSQDQKSKKTKFMKKPKS